MKLVFDDMFLINVYKGEYEGKSYYQATFLENGYTVRFSCSQAFYDTFKAKLKDQNGLELHGVKAEYREYGDKKRIKLV